MLYLHKKENSSTLSTVSIASSYQENESRKKESLFIKYAQRKPQKEQVSVGYMQNQGHRLCLSESALSSMSVEERTCMYEQKYTGIFEANSSLRAWIKSNKEKGPPQELTEEYRSLSRYPLPSASMPYTQSRRSMFAHPTHEPELAPSPKHSFSTFLKKTIRSSSGSLSKQQSKSYPQLTKQSDFFYQTGSPKSSVSSLPTTKKSSRFSLSSSLNRLSSIKQHGPMTDDWMNKRLQTKTTDSSVTNDSLQENACLNRENDIKMREMQQSLPTMIGGTESNPLKYSKQANRPQSAVVPSVFLDRLHRQSIYEDRSLQDVRSNTYKDSVGKKNMRTGSVSSSSVQHCYQEIFDSDKDIYFASKVQKKGVHHTLSSVPQRYKSSFVLADETKKKKRMSFSFAPSFSTMRLIPQKSHTWKRQSMLA